MREYRRAPLHPVLLVLRIALHAMVVSLVAFVGVRTAVDPGDRSSWALALAIVLLVSYLGGATLMRATASRTAPIVWLALVSIEILGLLALTPDAAFLAFPLYFLQLHLLPARLGISIVVVTAVATVAGITLHEGPQIGGVAGPLIGAAVAVVIGQGYRTLYREMREREQLIAELERTRGELAAREHEAGVLAERGRLAREIHDTVAQGLSSIQMLLHAAERDGARGAVLDHIRLARETAADDLAETRRFIRELSPAALEGRTLEDALERLTATASRDGLDVSFTTNGESAGLPMNVEATLLRIAQASLSNVSRHARARRAEVTLTRLDDWVGLDIVDDGQGFSTKAIDRESGFGLNALRSRVRELGGRLDIESSPGEGTAIAVSFDLAEST